jgi:hypothetical protein
MLVITHNFMYRGGILDAFLNGFELGLWVVFILELA